MLKLITLSPKSAACTIALFTVSDVVPSPPDLVVVPGLTVSAIFILLWLTPRPLPTTPMPLFPVAAANPTQCMP